MKYFALIRRWIQVWQQHGGVHTGAEVRGCELAEFCTSWKGLQSSSEEVTRLPIVMAGVCVLQRWCVFLLVSCETGKSRSTSSTLGGNTRQMRCINIGVDSSMCWVFFLFSFFVGCQEQLNFDDPHYLHFQSFIRSTGIPVEQPSDFHAEVSRRRRT